MLNYIEKTATQQELFSSKYPSFDGRGIKIAIIDSGVDVSLVGLQKTSEGLPKIIDCFDFTGAGDVDTSTVMEMDSENILIGLSGRKLKIPLKWKNPSGKWHLGIKSLYKPLLTEMPTEKDCIAWNDGEKWLACIDTFGDLEEVKVLTKEEYENIDILFVTEMGPQFQEQNILSGLNNRKIKIPIHWKNPSGHWQFGLLKIPPGPSFNISYEAGNEKLPEMDCIVWNDGEKWLACIETFGDLEDAKILTNFRDENDYGILKNNLSYCITVHNDGKLLEIFTPHIDHGSTVAQIAAAHFPNKPENDGLAPGAQIISMNVADIRNKNLMNEKALKKALQKCIEMKVDIVNYSIQSFQRDPEIRTLINEMVQKHNIMIFKGAGNSGPFYSTVCKSDVHIRNSIFTIGALYTPEADKNVYHSIIKNDIAVVSNFSSKGPDADGNTGISFVAPGNAIVDIPRFNILKNRVSYGTSLSSPNAAGSVACLLSALKHNKIQYSFSMIKYVLFKTAKIPQKGNKLEFGHGIIQIDAAFDYCKNGIDTLSMELWTNKENANIYFVQKDAYTKEFEFKLPNLSLTSADEMVTNWILKLSSEAQKYINVSEINSDNSFSIKIDTAKLEEGSLNFAEIEVLHHSNPVFNHIFDIPITVIVPIKLTETQNRIEKEITLNNTRLHHIFIDLSTFKTSKKCEMKITALHKTETQLRIRYAVEDDALKFEKAEARFDYFQENESHTHSFTTEGNMLCEVCVNQVTMSVTLFKILFES